MSVRAIAARSNHEPDDRLRYRMPWSDFAPTDFSYRNAAEHLGAEHADWLRERMHERRLSVVAFLFHLFMLEQAALAAGFIEGEPIFYETLTELPVPLARQVARYLLAHGRRLQDAGGSHTPVGSTRGVA